MFYEHRSSGIQEFRNSGIQKFWNLGIQEGGESGRREGGKAAGANPHQPTSTHSRILEFRNFRILESLNS